ncbi:MAG: hypothetical protein B6D39_01850 [Anaerolineae bacterium UTCFX2]|jgi:D-3-phosphoglycerate dehydrogenase|nr:hypothetical protein [Anaerolineales bacterium]OQY94249.1 MAG: hypothetical protein B6D39_01850 [Anaerolineae bacterium UTCFX2]
MTWKILISDGLENNGQSVLHPHAQVVDRSGISASELLQEIPEYDALIIRGCTRITADLLRNARRLRVIGRAGVGVDNIDLAAAQACNITVVNTPTSTTRAVVELTLGLIFCLARSIPRAEAALKEGRWLKKELIGNEINGMTLGVIGMGNIGMGIVQITSQLGLKAIAYDAFLTDAEIARRGAQPTALDALYSRADIITIHTPLNETTRHIIDDRAVALMKPGVYLICTARGGVVDEQALLAGLESGRIAGAALDVFEQEPPGQTALIRHPNLIATPHIGAQTVEAQRRAAVDIAEEVLAALESRPLRWQII